MHFWCYFASQLYDKDTSSADLSQCYPSHFGHHIILFLFARALYRQFKRVYNAVAWLQFGSLLFRFFWRQYNFG